MLKISHAVLVIVLIFSACTEKKTELEKPAQVEDQKKDEDANDADSANETIYYLKGSSNDIQTNSSSGYLLAGGAGDQKSWFDWMVDKSDGGDFVIIRTDDSDGYNDDTFIEGANSILTLVIDSQIKANSDFVKEKIRNAEAIFIAGGNQTEYYNYWNETEVEAAIHYLVNEKGVPVGGTSAGLAILGEFAYVPESLGINSSEALNDPYHLNMKTIRLDFLHLGGLEHIITDSHFSERDRLGRTITFMARLITDGVLNAYQDLKGIAVDEFTAVAIEANGDAKVLGDERHEDYAFFLHANSAPDQCEAGKALNWTDAITAYAVKGIDNPAICFNINDWTPLTSAAKLETVNINAGRVTNDIQKPN